jgi:hypothetical protein
MAEWLKSRPFGPSTIVILKTVLEQNLTSYLTTHCRRFNNCYNDYQYDAIVKTNEIPVKMASGYLYPEHLSNG